MTRIIISQNKGSGNKWCPFKKKWEFLGKDMEKIIEDEWDKLKYTKIYIEVKNDIDDLCCKSDYASDPRPMDSVLFEGHEGCVFDLDAYNEGVDYICKEIGNLPSEILVGAISKQTKKLPSNQEVENLYELPINDEKGVYLYLRTILLLIKGEVKKKKTSL